MNDLALLGGQRSKRLVNGGAQSGIAGCAVDRLDEWTRVSDDDTFSAAPPQCAETFVADGATQIAALVVDACRSSTAADQRHKDLLNGVRGARGIS